MTNIGETIGFSDSFDLARFIKAQEGVYGQVVSELKNGQKQSHWMWFIFPQIDGLGHSPTTKRYAIKSIEEAREYLAHPVLGERLVECAKIILDIEGRTVSEIFGSPDDRKLRSSMTLFACIAEPGSVFDHVLEKFFDGRRDDKTLNILEAMNKDQGTRT